MMKLALPLLCLLSGASALKIESTLSPVTRVVELLKHLSDNIEKEGKAEEDLYETYVCWAKSIISQKTKSNAASSSRIDELSTYISDLEAGRIELTSERQDLEKQIKTLTDEIEAAGRQRDQEEKDFEEAESEMNQAIEALGKAIDVMKTATEGHEDGVLLSVEGRAGATYSQRAKEAASLQKAVVLGAKVLSKGDALFLQRLLTGEVPKPDWKKLNRKATFKMSYKKRSGKIQETLAKLLQEFEDNLKDATDTEKKAIATYETLMKSKNEELDTAQEARENMDGENGAKAMSKTEAKDELDRLTAEVEADTKYIASVEKQLAEKKEEWKDRQALRTGELGAISKAISILHSDDSRDLFKKSFESQDRGASFVQLRSTLGLSALKSKSAVETLKEASRKSGDARLSALAASAVVSGSHFDEVISAIDKMIATLETEEAEDLEAKETCEQERMEDTKEAQVFARTIDEHTDTITRLEGEIADIKKAHKEAEEKHAENEKEIAEIEDFMKKTEAQAKAEIADDEAAVTVVESATEVLANFYRENDLVFVQKAKQPFTSTAGDAPPPPPPTWEAPYGGKTGESQGIVAILTMVADDIKKDAQKTKADMDSTLESSNKEKGNLEDENKELSSEMKELEKTQGDKEMSVSENKGDRNTQKQGLDGVMQVIKDKTSFCEFFTVNYPLRLKNRQIEMDGLKKAKTILSGGSFTAVDEGREIKPGDALLQAPRRLRSARK